MSSNRTPVLIALLAIVLLAAVFYYTYQSSKPKYDWSDSWSESAYQETNAEPYGTQIPHEGDAGQARGGRLDSDRFALEVVVVRIAEGTAGVQAEGAVEGPDQRDTNNARMRRFIVDVSCRRAAVVDRFSGEAKCPQAAAGRGYGCRAAAGTVNPFGAAYQGVAAEPAQRPVRYSPPVARGGTEARAFPASPVPGGPARGLSPIARYRRWTLRLQPG